MVAGYPKAARTSDNGRVETKVGNAKHPGQPMEGGMDRRGCPEVTAGARLGREVQESGRKGVG